MGFVTDLCANFATEYRGWFVITFVLPFSVMFDVYYKIRAWLVMKLYSAPQLHQRRLEDIKEQILKFRADPENNKKKLCTARGGWQSISPSLRTYKAKAQKISINLYDILEFDENKKTVKVEPMVNMGQLSHFLIPKGYTIPVLPEMDDLTCGGLLMGVGIETSSHKYGLLNDCIVEAEIITSEGEILTCSKTQNRELFDVLPWSYGTIGFLVSMTIRVVPSKPYVKMWYVPCYKAQDSSAVYKALVNKKKTTLPPKTNDYFVDSAAKHEFDFVEGLMYTRDKLMTMPAKFVDSSEVKFSNRNCIGLWYKPWFYKHVETFFGKAVAQPELSKKLCESEDIEQYLDSNFWFEYIPLRDYNHRHTKSIFWELEEIIPFGNHWIVRYLLGWALPPKVSFLKITQTQAIRDLYEKSHCIQDMLVPESELDSSLDVFEDQYGIYPLWICPYRAYDYGQLSRLDEGVDGVHRCFLKAPKQLVDNEAYEMYVDLGAYGIPREVREKKPFDVVKNSRIVENFVHSVHGFQMLYATSYQDRSEFREMFDHSHYDKMKAKYDKGNNFPKVYEKVCKKALKLWESGEISK